MSHYAQYLTERTEDQIYETEDGFVTWRYIDQNTVYIVDIYVLRHCRNSGNARALADHVVEKAKQSGRKELLGTVVPSVSGSTDSIKVLIAYGMQVKSASDNLIVFRKEI